ncbi:MAG: thiamine pyrophosphate-dependent enzyme [Actinomycetota bacterium]
MLTSIERRQLLSDPVEQYRRMREIRELEERIVGLFSEGLVHGTTHTCQGQEALAVGLAASLNPDDAVSCTYRGHGIALALGLTPDSVLGAEIAHLVGGPEILIARALDLVPTDLRLACHLADLAGWAAPDDVVVHEGRAAVYDARRREELSLMAKGIFTAAARESKDIVKRAALEDD